MAKNDKDVVVEVSSIEKARVLLEQLETEKTILPTERLRKEQRVQTLLLLAIHEQLVTLNGG